MSGLTLYDKLWQSHLVKMRDDGSALIYIDRHILHEVTSPQAFEGLRTAKRPMWRTSSTIATADHNIPTTVTEREAGLQGIFDPIAKIQVKALDDNCDEFNVTKYGMNHPKQGIVHVIGAETGACLPGMTIVCGDSHTSTNGALGALAHGIGTSEIEHVMATQTLVAKKMKNMRINIDGDLRPGVSAKDIVLYVTGEIGTAGATGHAVEFAGSAIERLSMEGRMTICNMAVELGARAGLVAVDNTTLNYLKGKEHAPKDEMWEKAVTAWGNLRSDDDAIFDTEVNIDAAKIMQQVTWGTSPEMVTDINGKTPNPAQESNLDKKRSIERALAYMGLKPDQNVQDINIDRVFIGSCTNSRIEDMRAAAEVVKGRRKADSVIEVIVVPGSGAVKRQAEEEGLDVIFKDAGFEWREPGCSMCLAMNPDKLLPGERCASTSNRNFESRQGFGGRTHLVSPAVAAAAGIAGHFIEVEMLVAS
ncbi:3-isopropylmalate dehydratase large subunit [Vibrio hyugaensis]|uniref:3-isopropylmalate dehydratase large subunit n=1 Tax=Vibrio hyugaensis TaxID=1534743 RepID=UPI0005F08835|nr:3-isopropylmalate dehydratase large subunit [Vibrio hyugaensis]